jgi:hypothetical protein
MFYALYFMVLFFDFWRFMGVFFFVFFSFFFFFFSFFLPEGQNRAKMEGFVSVFFFDLLYLKKVGPVRQSEKTDWSEELARDAACVKSTTQQNQISTT